MRNMMDPGGHEELAEILCEFYAPLGSERFIVVGISGDNSIAVSPVGWKPNEETIRSALNFVSSSPVKDRFTVT